MRSSSKGHEAEFLPLVAALTGRQSGSVSAHSPRPPTRECPPVFVIDPAAGSLDQRLSTWEFGTSPCPCCGSLPDAREHENYGPTAPDTLDLDKGWRYLQHFFQSAGFGHALRLVEGDVIHTYDWWIPHQGAIAPTARSHPPHWRTTSGATTTGAMIVPSKI